MKENKNEELLRKYQKGIITEKEYNDLFEELETPLNFLEKTNNTEKLEIEDLDEILSLKLDKEFNEFCNSLKNKTSEEIINTAYEITTKEEIKDELKNMNLYEQEKLIMIKQKELLNEFYHDWLDTDVPLGDSMKDTLEESVISLTRYYDKQNNKKEER